MALKEKNKANSGEATGVTESGVVIENAQVVESSSHKKINILFFIIFTIMFLALMGVMGFGVWILMDTQKIISPVKEELNKDGKAGAHDSEKDKKNDKKKEKVESFYTPIDPGFVIQLPGAKEEETVILQIDVTVMTSTKETSDIIKNNIPLIRNDLIKLFSVQNPKALKTPEGREKLQEESKTVINSILNEHGINAKIDEVLFTNILVQ